MKNRVIALLLLLAGCEGVLSESVPTPRIRVDAGPRDAAVLLPGEDAGPDQPAIDAGPREPDPIDPGSPRLAPDLELVSLEAYQAVRVELAAEGAPVAARSSPLVAGRETMIRIGVRPSASFAARTVRAEIVTYEGDRVLGVHADEIAVRGPTGAARESAFEIRLPAAEVTIATAIAARLVDPAGDAPAGAHPARLPRDGTAMPLSAESDGSGLELVLVPVSWEADGSGRMPDTSEAQLQRIRDLLLALYPIAHLDIRMHEPVAFHGGSSWGGVDFGSLNDQLMDVRARDGASARAYYYGLVRSADSFDEYCGGGCTTGMSYIADSARDEWMRVGSGIGFGDAESAWTLAHEIGHQYGRYHAPCGVSDADWDYPHSGGSIGVWGWDARRDVYLDPSDVADFMSYCHPQWISDYTWRAMFERTVAVARLAPVVRGGEVTLRRLRVLPDRAVWGGTITARTPDTAERARVRFLDAGGAELARAEAGVASISHSAERVLFVPAPPAGTSAVEVTLGGEARAIAW